MSWKYAKLFEVAVEHAYFDGAKPMPFTLAPTVGTAKRLAAHRLLFKQTGSGGVVLYEVDPFDPNEAKSIATIPSDLVLEFALQSTSPLFPTVTAFSRDQAAFCALSNVDGVADGASVRLHGDEELEDADLAPLKSQSFPLHIETAQPSVAVELIAPDGRSAQRETVIAENGTATFNARLSEYPSGRYTLFIDDVDTGPIYADTALARQKPVAVISLRAFASGLAPLCFLDANGDPAFKAYRLRFPARATTWRYIVVARGDTSLDEGNLFIEDTILVNGNPRYAFQPVGPKAPLSNGESAVIFQSDAPIALKRSPDTGLLLKKSVGANGFSNLISNLPNPHAGSLSLASDAQDVSDVFVYV